MGGTSVRRRAVVPDGEVHRSDARSLRAGDPPDLVVHRRNGFNHHLGHQTNEQRRSRAVVADVHTVTRHGMRALLDMCGTVDVVAEASSAGEAIHAVVESGADLIVLGAQPSDHAIIKRIRHEAPFTKVLVMSPTCDEQEVVRAIQAGASGFISKSARPEEFTAAVDALRAGAMYLDRAAAVVIRAALERNGGSSRRRARIGDLTEREVEVARLVSEGLTARRIASRLGISDRTVNTHIGSLYRRLGVNNRVDAVRELMRLGVAPSPR